MKFATKKLTIDYECWVLHSPYPDISWRGAEKCVTTEGSSAPLIFASLEEALDYQDEHALIEFVPVKLALVMPPVRGPLGGN